MAFVVAQDLGVSRRYHQLFFATLSRSLMSFATPWLPVFNNTQLALYPAYADLIEDAAVPVFKEDPEWSRRSFKALFDTAPQVEEALWEVILAIWRLRLVQTEGIKEESWRKLVSAWLVSTQ